MSSAARTSPTRPSDSRSRPVGLDSSPLHGDLLGLEQLEDRAR